MLQLSLWLWKFLVFVYAYRCRVKASFIYDLNVVLSLMKIAMI